MGGRSNWSQIAKRRLMRQRGVEDVKGGYPLVAPVGNAQPRRRLSKTELREQAAAAFLTWRARQTPNGK